MQIFTTQIVLDTIHQVHEVKQMFFDVLLANAFRNVLGYFAEIWTALIQHNWHFLLVGVIGCIGGVTLIYRLVRSKPLMAFRSIFDR